MVAFSIIITNYNGLSYLKPCLNSIEKQEFRDFEIIFVDNCSQDDSVLFVHKNFPDIKIIMNTTNRGYAGGCNDGARVAMGDFFLFLNTDTTLDPFFLTNLDEGIRQYPDYGMYAPKMVYPDGRINSTGICISLSGAAWDRGMGQEDLGQYDNSEDILGPCGGAALFRREAFFNAGGFDDDFFLFMEDVDLVFRTQCIGWRCRYIPKALVYHHHGGTAGVGSDITVYYGNRNILWYPVKDFPLWLLFLSMPWMVGRTIGVIFYYNSKGIGRVAIQSKWDALKGLPSIVRKRKQISRTYFRLSFIRHSFFIFARYN